MMKAAVRVSLLAAFLYAGTSIALAQERIHAVSGTVTAINPKIEMTEIETDDGSSGHFKWIKKPGASIDFDKNVNADAVPAEKFATKGAHVILYYYGEGQVRTVVALHDLGDGSIQKSSGTVIKLDRHEHVLTIKNSTGSEVTYHLSPKTVGDTATGVMEGYKFDFDKGNQVRVLAAQTNGEQAALLIVPVI
jgi:hypothetical protein